MIIAPVRFRDRWIDDSHPIELWDDKRRPGVGLAVARANDAEPSLAVMTIWWVTKGPRDSTSLILDLASGEIRDQHPLSRVLDPPLDLAWLRGRLDDELRAALQQRLDRPRGPFDRHAWKDGDRPRVALGERAAFARLFPASWDIVMLHRGRRYALIDSHHVAPEARNAPVAVEIVDLETRETVGTAEIDLAHASPGERRRTPPWRSSGPAVVSVLRELWDDPDQWFTLIGRAETVARAAAVMQAWDSDVRDPDAAVAALLAAPGEEDELLQDRVKALGRRSIPALRRAFETEAEETSRYAARVLAELGDASGLDLLVTTLGDPAFDDSTGESFPISDAIAVLGARAVDPLLAALARPRSPDAQDRLLDAVTTLGVHDDRIRELLLEIVRAQPGRASRLGDYDDRSPAVVAVLVELLEAQLGLLRDDFDDDDAFDDASELAQALRDLGVDDGAVQQFGELIRTKHEHRLTRLRLRQPVREPALSEPMPRYVPPAPVHVTPRPGRNEPCWCGSNKKYKKCHLEADDEARAR